MGRLEGIRVVEYVYNLLHTKPRDKTSGVFLLKKVLAKTKSVCYILFVTDEETLNVED